MLELKGRINYVEVSITSVTLIINTVAVPANELDFKQICFEKKSLNTYHLVLLRAMINVKMQIVDQETLEGVEERKNGVVVCFAA